MDTTLAFLEELELELLQPSTRANSARINELIADDFLEIGSAGVAFDKDVVLAHLPKEDGKHFQVSNLRSRMLSEGVCLVTYFCVRTHRNTQVHSLRSSIWLKRGSSWQMTYHQATKCDPALSPN
jgi:hypothetical protein